MDKNVRDAIDRYTSDRAAEIAPKDMDVIHDFLIMTLMGSGVPLVDAIKIVHLSERGSWDKGWAAGYASGTNRATQRFSPNKS